MSVRMNVALAAFLGAAIFAWGCGGRRGRRSSPSSEPASSSDRPSTGGSNVSLDKNAYPVFPTLTRAPIHRAFADQGGRDSRAKAGRPTRISI